MPMTREQWKKANIAAGGRGLDSGFAQHQANVAARPSAPPPPPAGAPRGAPPAPPGPPPPPAGPQGAPPPPAPARQAPPPPPPQGGGTSSGYTGMSREQFMNAPGNARKHPGILEAEWQAHVARKSGFGGAQATRTTTNGNFEASGDSTGLRAHSNRHNMGSHGYGDFDDATLQSWKDTAWDDNCPPHTPFQAFDGSGCVEKPIDSTRSVGDPNSIHQLNTSGGVAGGGGGRGGGGSRGAGRSTTRATEGLPASAEGASNTIWDQIRADLEGGPSRYSDENVAAIEADQFARARRQEELQLEESQRDAALRGTSRSGGQASAQRDIRSGTGQQILANRSQIAQAKVTADYEDRQAAIQNSLNWLQQLRQYMLQSDMNSIQREQMAAQIAMANKQLSWQTAENDRGYQRNLSTYALTSGDNPF